MRKMIYYYATCLFIMTASAMLMACSSDKEDDVPKIPEVFMTTSTDYSSDKEDGEHKDRELFMTVSDITGYMRYNVRLQKWHILNFVTDTIDSFNDYYPLELDDEYKIEGLEVKMSGDVYDRDCDIPSPQERGQKIYYIQLAKIEKVKWDDNNYPFIPYPKEQMTNLKEKGCFSGCVIAAKSDEDTIKVAITETPDRYGLYYWDPSNGTYVNFLKGDLQKLNIQEGDVIDFLITRYKMLHIVHSASDVYCVEYFCNVEPCK